MTPWLIKLMIVEYAVIVLWACVEHRWKWALYYFGAILISVAVLWMGDE